MPGAAEGFKRVQVAYERLFCACTTDTLAAAPETVNPAHEPSDVDGWQELVKELARLRGIEEQQLAKELEASRQAMQM